MVFLCSMFPICDCLLNHAVGTEGELVFLDGTAGPSPSPPFLSQRNTFGFSSSPSSPHFPFLLLLDPDKDISFLIFPFLSMQKRQASFLFREMPLIFFSSFPSSPSEPTILICLFSLPPSNINFILWFCSEIQFYTNRPCFSHRFHQFIMSFNRT